MPLRSASDTFSLHDTVLLAVEKDGHPQGTAGAVVDAYPEAERYTVELFDDEGETLELVDVLAGEIRRRIPRVNGSSNSR
jgi:hypothetical protein